MEALSDRRRRPARGSARPTLRALGTSARLATLLAVLACEPASAPEAPADPAVEPAAATSASPGRGWNLVLITLDTTRADALGSYGQPRAVTPQLDRLAASGVLFEQVQSTGPSTLPSHATLFTGRLPPGHGVRSNVGYRLDDRAETLAGVLGRHGYATGAEIASAVLGRHTGIARGFEQVRDVASPGVTHTVVRRSHDEREMRLPSRTGPDVSRHALDFLREHRDERFFLWLHYFDPHSPYSPPRTFRRLVPDSLYHAEVAYTDSALGLVANEIEKLGLEERTLLVVTADHGEGLGEHGEDSHAYFLYQTTLRIPLLFWGPPELAPRRVTAAVGLQDLAPTILDLLELPPLPGASGRSLRAVVEGRVPEPEQRPLYSESIELARVLSLPPLRSLRQGRWKLIHEVGPELYDLESDPGETHDLAAEEPERVAALRRELERVLRGIDPGGAPHPEDGERRIDARTARELEALGYAAGGTVTPDSELLDSLALHGPDPASLRDDVQRVIEAQGALLGEDYEAAAAALPELARRYPESSYLQGQAGAALRGVGRLSEAIAHLERAHALDPGNLDALRHLARSHVQAGHTERGIALLRELLEVAPCDPARAAWNTLLQQAERYEEALAVLEEGAARCPDDRLHLNNLAWALATLPDASLRDAPRALALAERSVALAGDAPDANALDTLAAAQAAVGDPASAAATQLEAVRALRERGVSASAREPFEQRLRDYRSRARR